MLRSTWKVRNGIVLITTCLLSFSSTVFALLLEDGVFQPGNWTEVVIFDDTPAGAVFAVDQVQTGGNPGEFRRTRHAIAGGSIVLGHLHNTAIYDPSVSGSIVALSFSFDLRFLGGSAGTSQVGYRLLLEQDGFFYFSNEFGIAQGPGNGFPGAWTPFAFFGLGASSFQPLSAGSPAHPNFSSSGSVIRFGFLTTNTASVPIDVLSGIDNWTVTVTNVADVLPPCAGPEPGVSWKNHGQFVSHVVQEANRLVADGIITEDEKDAIVNQAARSSCGQQ